jgi:Calcineurin-like phosphoesterase
MFATTMRRFFGFSTREKSSDSQIHFPLFNRIKNVFDIIPDIHGDQDRLTKTLSVLGYFRSNGAYRHPEGRTAVFLGDLIDGGTENASVIDIVRSMISEKSAHCIMGNHELNAILFHSENASGPLRSRSEKNTLQHQTFLDEFPMGNASTIEAIGFFKTLPLCLDFGAFRVVHACWHKASLNQLGFSGTSCFLDPNNLEAASGDTLDENPIALLLKGPEVPLPDGNSFKDIKGHERSEVRLKWWGAAEGSLRDVVLSVPNVEDIPEEEIPDYMLDILYAEHEPPVFCGHYKMKGVPEISSPNAACLDFPEAPCAYRWEEGAKSLSKGNLVII